MGKICCDPEKLRDYLTWADWKAYVNGELTWLPCREDYLEDIAK